MRGEQRELKMSRAARLPGATVCEHSRKSFVFLAIERKKPRRLAEAFLLTRACAFFAHGRFKLCEASRLLAGGRVGGSCGSAVRVEKVMFLLALRTSHTFQTNRTYGRHPTSLTAATTARLLLSCCICRRESPKKSSTPGHVGEFLYR